MRRIALSDSVAILIRTLQILLINYPQSKLRLRCFAPFSRLWSPIGAKRFVRAKCSPAGKFCHSVLYNIGHIYFDISLAVGTLRFLEFREIFNFEF